MKRSRIGDTLNNEWSIDKFSSIFKSTQADPEILAGESLWLQTLKATLKGKHAQRGFLNELRLAGSDRMEPT